MAALNYRHLRYFWVVARTGSVARAGERLHLTPHAISTQLGELETALGVRLFQRAGRGLALTETGQRVLSYADEIFALGDELLDALQQPEPTRALPLRVGITDVVPKSVAHRLIAPALRLEEPLRLACREGALDTLLAELAVQRLDVVIADRPVPPTVNVRAYNHLLGEGVLAVYGTRELLRRLPGRFPARLQGAPLLLPGEGSVIRPRILQWFETRGIRPHVIGEFDDSALMKAFGQSGTGLFVAPAALRAYLARTYGVQPAGELDGVVEQAYLISTARRITHPAVLAMQEAARGGLFGTPRRSRGA